MRKTEYGFAEINARGKVYNLAPSFLNISKIGTPKQIIQEFRNLQYRYMLPKQSFTSACNVLQCCGLPEELTGGLSFSERQNKFLIRPGLLPIEHVFILAEHCFAHGICGIINDDDEEKDKVGEPLEAFNIYEYMMDAVEFLGVTLDQAEQMTMTQFVYLVKAKNNNMKKRDPEYIKKKQVESEAEEMQRWHREMAAKADAHNKKMHEQNNNDDNKKLSDWDKMIAANNKLKGEK